MRRQILKGVLAQDPQFALAQSELGLAYFIQYRSSPTPELLEQARAACNRAIAIEPNLAPPYVTLARIEAMAGNNALATQHVQRALQLDPHSADAYGAQSEVFSAEGRRVRRDRLGRAGDGLSTRLLALAGGAGIVLLQRRQVAGGGGTVCESRADHSRQRDCAARPGAGFAAAGTLRCGAGEPGKGRASWSRVRPRSRRLGRCSSYRGSIRIR